MEKTGTSKPKGFAKLAITDPERMRKIAQKGGREGHIRGTAHEWNTEEASKAGRKGGLSSRGGRKSSLDRECGE